MGTNRLKQTRSRFDFVRSCMSTIAFYMKKRRKYSVNVNLCDIIDCEKKRNTYK